MKVLSLITLILFSIAQCEQSSTPTKGEQIIYDAIEAHGGKRYEDAHYEFIFRDKKYTFKNDKENYVYTASYLKDGKKYFDSMDNNMFSRTVDQLKAELTTKQESNARESLNSVIYFATLPYKLLDKSVNKSYVGEVSIKNKKYKVVQVTFNEEGGGKDFDDTYHYWINNDTNIIDYLAYNYKVGKGGVRFRSAYNPRIVGGILFQDYINYKAEIGTPLIELPGLWEEGKLKELSRIDTEDIKELRKTKLK